MLAFFSKIAALFGWARPKLPSFEPDLVYGSDELQTLDVYHPDKPNGEVIFMVHGGGWRRGDKAMPNVVDNKVAHYVPLGYTFVTINYRLGADIDPIDQTNDVAEALAFCQGKAKAWGCDANNFILMGHSAGAHLVALYASAPVYGLLHNTAPILGTVALDSAAYDVTQIMTHRHPSLYDEAFGPDPSFWSAASPIERLNRAPKPMLLVAGVTGGEETERFENVQAFADKISQLGGRAPILKVELSHGDVNGDLGVPGEYTDAVDKFLRTLAPRA